jgi:hypothetical protein
VKKSTAIQTEGRELDMVSASDSTATVAEPTRAPAAADDFCSCLDAFIVDLEALAATRYSRGRQSIPRIARAMPVPGGQLIPAERERKSE